MRETLYQEWLKCVLAMSTLYTSFEPRSQPGDRGTFAGRLVGGKLFLG
jgi:hypothetical protein